VKPFAPDLPEFLARSIEADSVRAHEIKRVTKTLKRSFQARAEQMIQAGLKNKTLQVF
jgi:hypothetical protein